jgi:hypothetical protein
LAAGSLAAEGSGFAGAGGLAGFSATAGLASSSAMMRRIDAKISSIEGSWTFAGCVISDSTSSRPRKRFYTKQGRILPVLDKRVWIFIAPARLVPRSKTPPNASSDDGPAQCTEAFAFNGSD